MRALIKNNVRENAILDQPGKTMAEKRCNYERTNWKWREDIESMDGEWVEIETEHLFEDQFNTANSRISWTLIEQLDPTPEFKDKEDLLQEIQRQYNIKWPGRKVKRYYIDQICK